jgi:hypothetical protein
MSSFRNINYGRLLFETLRNYFSVNATGEMSLLYKFLAAIVQPLQPPFDALVAYRTKEALIANCKWQIGQLTNVLNYLYDTTLKRIFITQSVLTVIADPMFEYAPVNFDVEFGETTSVFEREFGDRVAASLVTINIPSSVNESDLVATVEQIRMQGIPYIISVF